MDQLLLTQKAVARNPWREGESFETEALFDQIKAYFEALPKESKWERAYRLWTNQMFDSLPLIQPPTKGTENLGTILSKFTEMIKKSAVSIVFDKETERQRYKADGFRYIPCEILNKFESEHQQDLFRIIKKRTLE